MGTDISQPRVYLAGPDVFLPNAADLCSLKKAICTEHGLQALWPLDNVLDLSGLAPPAAGLAIAKANEELMQESAAIIANLTPWDGPSADAGTCFELGYMRALGRPCFAYSNDVRSYEQRVEVHVLEHDQGPMKRDEHGHKITASGRRLECFQLNDNLMLDGAVHLSGGSYCLSPVPAWDRHYYTELAAFRLAVAACARALGTLQKGNAVRVAEEV